MSVYTTITTITGMKEILPINFINAIAANTACNIAINNGKPKLKVILIIILKHICMRKAYAF